MCMYAERRRDAGLQVVLAANQSWVEGSREAVWLQAVGEHILRRGSQGALAGLGEEGVGSKLPDRAGGR
jgi:hypothetical protein